MISASTYRDILKPYQQKIVERAKKIADVKVVLHSEGSIYDVIPDLIEIGVDVINPIQHDWVI